MSCVRMFAVSLAAAISFAGFASPARAQVADLNYDLRIDIPVLVVSSSWLIGSEIARPSLAAKRCRWCDRNADGSNALNAFDDAFRDALRWNEPSLSNLLSSVTGYGLVPAASIGLLTLAQAHDDALSNILIDWIAIAQAVTISAGLTQVTKFVAARERPYVHELSADQKAHTSQPSNNNTSFFSGHTNFAFSLAVAAGTVATLRNYRWAGWVWVAGLVFATATGYLRIASDSHYVTDVLAGAWVASATSVAVPYLLHRPLEPLGGSSIHVNRMPGGVFVSLVWSDRKK